MDRGLSTLTEVIARGEIFDISLSTLRENIYVCIFFDGTQCNIDEETFKIIQKNKLIELLNETI